jgi:hypothetical protein
VHLIFRSNDPTTTEFLSKAFGEREVIKKFQSSQFSPNDLGDRLSTSEQENCWQIRRGEKGARIEFWQFPTEAASHEDEPRRDARDPRDDRFIYRVYTVFNAAQIEGIPSHAPRVRQDWEIIQAGESILRNSGARIYHDQADLLLALEFHKSIEEALAHVNECLHAPIEQPAIQQAAQLAISTGEHNFEMEF